MQSNVGFFSFILLSIYTYVLWMFNALILCIFLEKSCGFPGFFPSGWIEGQSYLFESQLEYFCKPGYRLVGNRFRTCMENQTWSGRTPSCQGAVYNPIHFLLFLINKIHLILCYLHIFFRLFNYTRYLWFLNTIL